MNLSRNQAKLLAKRRTPKLWVVACLLACGGLVSIPAHAERVLEVYETYWPAEKIMPLIQDILNPGDNVSVFRNKIIIRTERANHEEIQRVLDEVDHPPRNLLISVRQSDQDQASTQGQQTQIGYEDAERGVRIGRADDDGSVIIYRGSSSDGQVSMRTVPRRAISTHNNDSVHQVRVVEGEQGFISLGKEIPLQERAEGWDSSTQSGYHSTATQSYKPVEHGLYVTPMLQKDRVYLEISSERQQIAGTGINRSSNQAPPQINTSALHTTTSIPLGLWMPLGGVELHAKKTGAGFSWSTRRKDQQNTGYEIKVDLVN
ncbi:Hypothetical protein HDN1F_34390 [gamma proteobacterium HdN1]|nr:Hypothetical protein HDN1F_34390 [gamma proteobacterium HdN1]